MNFRALLPVAFFASSLFAAEPLRVPVTRDLWVSLYPTEQEGNNGASPKLKLKGTQEFFLADFDPAPLRGKKVARAQLHLHLEGAETLGRITVSTITAPWVEGTGNTYARTPGASSFAWARTDEARWPGGPDLLGMVLGAGGSVWGFGDAAEPDAERWQIVPVAPEVVQARIDGRGEGFFVMDDVGSEYRRDGERFEYRPFLNRYVTSREGRAKWAPYFTLWLAEENAAAPAPATLPVERTISPATLPPLPEPPLAGPKPPVDLRDEFGAPLTDLRFAAARKEFVGFIVMAPPAEVSVELPNVTVRRFALPRVAGVVDPLVPPEAAKGDVAGTYVELFLPEKIRAGKHTGALRVGAHKLPLQLTVWNFTLPDRLSFVPQMNCYSLPADARDYYRLAHEHRTTLNMLPYGWTGRVKAAPKIGGDGAWDWSAWDAQYGPLLDGSAFADLPRGAVPVDAFYLPLNENWPMEHERHFRGGYWIESAYGEEYWREFRAAAGQFARHLSARGWTEPVFEFYLNNKVSFKAQRGGRWDITSAAWILDEPSNTQDFWALRRFGLEFWRGVAGPQGVRFGYRADISRPQWQRDLLDGVTSVEVISGALRDYRPLVAGRAAQWKNQVYLYGAANRPGTSNLMPAAWCVEAWALGAEGVVPWQTIGGAESWTKPDELALFYPTERGPVPSIRLKSFRAGQQLVEYLTIYCALSGTPREAMAATLRADPAWQARTEKKSDDDAGGSRFGPATAAAWTQLRARLGTWLNAQAPAARERWHDSRPPPRDPAAVRVIAPVALATGSGDPR